MEYKREIEKKFYLEGTFKAAKFHLGQKFPKILDSSSTDRFWKVPGVDFVRARLNSKEITVKVTDKGDVLDRIEENVKVEDFDSALRLLTLLFGEPVLTQTKHFAVYQAPTAVFSLYVVEEDEKCRLFFESEADTEENVDQGVRDAQEVLRTNMDRVNKSLFQIFYEEKLNEG